MELLCDGVLELVPFPSIPQLTGLNHAVTSTKDETPQGMLNIHKLPTLHEKGGGSLMKAYGENLAFTMSRRKGLNIKPFNLPPVEGKMEHELYETKSIYEKAAEANIQF